MTDTETAQNRSQTTREPLPVHMIGSDALYEALRRLHAAATRTLRDVERNSTDVHRSLGVLADANKAAEDLFYPPPLPEKPEDAELMYAHAVREGDQVWTNEHGWLLVVEQGQTPAGGARWVLRAVANPGYEPLRVESSWNFVYPVRRRKPVEDPEATRA